ncbi:MAG: hypothetical protein MRY63_07745 [Neomegalonema sp.]|nr:hypothetical protein [Neomegalonema sp.]
MLSTAQRCLAPSRAKPDLPNRGNSISIADMMNKSAAQFGTGAGICDKTRMLILCARIGYNPPLRLITPF